MDKTYCVTKYLAHRKNGIYDSEESAYESFADEDFALDLYNRWVSLVEPLEEEDEWKARIELFHPSMLDGKIIVTPEKSLKSYSFDNYRRKE